jgi:hypothetical protein
MYAKALGALVALLLLASPASAHQRHHHYASRHHHAIHWGALPKSPEWPHSTAFGPRWTENTAHITVGGSRPRAWCGWFMRQIKGVADASYNLARNWTHWGSASDAHPGAVAVWAHHVGEVANGQCPAGAIMLHSGNDGHTVRTRCVSLRGVLAFREG